MEGTFEANVQRESMKGTPLTSSTVTLHPCSACPGVVLSTLSCSQRSYLNEDRVGR